MDVTGLVISGIVVLLWLGTLAWLYNDAEEKHALGCVWVIIAALFPFIGFAVYLIFFAGFEKAPDHTAPKSGEDLQYKAMYRRTPASAAGKKFENVFGEKSKMVTTPGVDADFRDETIDSLIFRKQYVEAREYVNDMIKMAREMNDSRGEANYSMYSRKLDKLQSGKKN